MKHKVYAVIAVAALALVTSATSADARRIQQRKVEQRILALHIKHCPLVSEYVNCAALKVTVRNAGPTGWSAQSGPAAGTVEYNSYYYAASSNFDSLWASNVAHEIGGHHDAWAEIVSKVGVTQAWTDYYDLNTFAVAFFDNRFTSTVSKEMWLDCAGPISHGYQYASYFLNRGLPYSECSGWEAVMTQALGGQQ